MGLFDRYVPDERLDCPVGHVALTEWQGKDGDAALFVWRKGHQAPVGQDAGDGSIPVQERAQFRLPDRFLIYSSDCGRHVVDAVGHCENGVWTRTEVVEAHPIQATIVSS